MPRRRLIPERVLSSTERSRRHRLRLRGGSPLAAPGRPKPLGPEWERLLGGPLLDLEKFITEHGGQVLVVEDAIEDTAAGSL